MSLAVKRGQSPHGLSRFDSGTVDRSFIVRRLRRNAATLIIANPRADYLGQDDLTEGLARAKGLSSDDVAVLRISIGSKRHTLVCAPSHIWHARKHDLLELKELANIAGRNCVLVPETAIQREPRLSVARAIEEAFGVAVTLEDRMAVLVHLIEAGGRASIMDCACAIKHPQPFSAVLHMVSLGAISLVAPEALTPHSVVSLCDLGAA